LEVTPVLCLPAAGNKSLLFYLLALLILALHSPRCKPIAFHYIMTLKKQNKQTAFYTWGNEFRKASGLPRDTQLVS
jgi:hypothetical protein